MPGAAATACRRPCSGAALRFTEVPPAVHFETLGCKLNQIESESAARYFSDAGFTVDMEPATAADAPGAAVLCVVNTCTVTGKAEQKARRVIRLLLRKYENAAVLVTGCYAELDAPQLAAIDGRVCVLPGSLKDTLADIPARFRSFIAADVTASECAAFLRRAVAAEKSAGGAVYTPTFRLATDTFFTHSRASIKIQDGCNNACTYCRIHLARGKAVSLDAASVLERVRSIEARNQHEVVLTGVNLSQYRGSFGSFFLDIAGLLRFLLDNTERIRFRLSSLYPERVDDALCEVIAHERIMPHFHLSVQSGSDRILTLMRRPYTSADVAAAVERLRAVKRNPFIACDIIAGFPGESDDDFGQTMELCRSCRFAWIHAFPFSPRPGTPAYAMKPVVPQSTAAHRVRRLTEFAIASKCAYISSYKGTVVSAITEQNRKDRKAAFETTAADDAGGARTVRSPVTHAVTSNFIHVELPGSFAPGSRIAVRITDALPEHIRNGDECEASAEPVYDEKSVTDL
ncbi:MiaB-like tRNA modifying enzyme [Treponema brennaborense DSM 12168]|uniref:MiaB-like tRNA modifying enzyme n=1 Tax=Treponema brennaborense (strain DSM 12168 / CIP 105900 / DD5/3) TaxID=906968 RepID=F4LQF6_TREBD|nr:MiaB-like tRNA modifying enzyme [Treponema brennaborense DSM 12168]